jgi:hypothetical protein
VMSQGSMPAAYTAADISRSPLDPSSRMMATRTCKGRLSGVLIGISEE